MELKMLKIKNMIVKALQIITLASMLLISHFAFSHELEQSYVFVTINDTSIDGRLEINIPDLNRALSLNLATDKSVKPEDIQRFLPEIRQYYSQHVSIDIGAGIVLDDFFLHTIPNAQYLALNFSFKKLKVVINCF